MLQGYELKIEIQSRRLERKVFVKVKEGSLFYLLAAIKTSGDTAKLNIITLYSIMYPRSSDLCNLITCFANCSTGIGGWSGSFTNSPGKASTLLSVPVTSQIY